MKTFLNVLYRRILYKIPLKFLLILLAVCAIFIASFSNADYIGDLSRLQNTLGARLSVDMYNDFIYCIYKGSSSASLFWYYSGDNSIQYSVGVNTSPSCFSSGTNIILYNSGTQSANYYVYNLSIIPSQYTKNECKSVYGLISEDECTGGGQMTSSDCQLEYNLIPISSIDSSYCQTNNLCPTCPSGGSGVDLTELYINNILHVGAPTILMNIPEEIDWDYAYTQGGNIMNIDVVGYNVDYEKIQNEIDIQNFKPNSDDLSSIVSNILPLFIPGLVIILFLYFLFKFIKKIF